MNNRQKIRLWLVIIVLAVVAGVVVIWMVAPKYGPLVLHAKQMEGFCAGLPDGLNRDQLAAMAEKQGYIVTPGHDAKGEFLKITSDDPSNTLGYSCEARFKPDGTIAVMNFTAGAKR